MIHGLAWIAATTLGLAVAGFVLHFPGSFGEPAPVGWSTEHAVAGVLVGLVWGTLTALAGLPEMLRRPSTEVATRPTEA